ncbi:MAG: ATP-binding protein [Aestuariibacter sp.]
MEELVKQLDTNNIFQRFVVSLLESETLEDVVWNIAKDAVGQLGFEDCIVYILEDQDTLVQKSAHGPKNPAGRTIKTPITIPVGQGIVGTVAKTGCPERINDTRLDPRYIVDDEVRLSELTVPIIYNDKVIGVLDSEHSTANYFTDTHVAQFTAIAKLAAPKIFHALAREHLTQLNSTLQDSNTRYRQLIEQCPDAIVVHQNEQIVYHNAAFASLVLSSHGRPLNETDIMSFIPEEHYEAFCASLAKCPDNAAWSEIEVTTRYCTRVSVATSSLPIPFQDGEAVQTIFHDITAYKRKEQELEAAIKRAEAANQAKSQFLSRVSHEFRTPLNAIIGFAQIQQMMFPDSPNDAKHGIKEIYRAGEHLLALVNDILDISQIEQKKLPIRMHSCDLYSVLQASISLVKPEADKQEIVIRAQPFDYVVLADQTRLKQVIVNLLNNAVKYNYIGGEISIEAGHISGQKIELRVSDSGIGIASEELELIFEPFTRLKQAEQHHFEGAGVGLSLVRTLLQEMDGAIRVESNPDRGSTFIVSLQTAEQIAEPKVAHDPNEELSLITQISMSILYIEDDRASAEVVNRIFATFPNVTLYSAESGAEGIVLATEHKFDLILLDMHLPDMSGIDVLQKLRQAGVRAKVIALSADVQPQQIERAISAGVEFYLTKPLHLPELMSCLRLINKTTSQV